LSLYTENNQAGKSSTHCKYSSTTSAVLRVQLKYLKNRCSQPSGMKNWGSKLIVWYRWCWM